MSDSPVIVGHRGWPSRYPDNTLAGFIAASSVVSMVELDVRRSGDGKLVLSHDPTLDGLLVSETPWSQLVEIDLGKGHHPALLDEVIAALPDTTIQFEVKNLPHQAGFEPDHRLALEAAERTRPGDYVTSFNPLTLDAVRRFYPDVRTGLAVEPVFAFDEAVQHCVDAGHSALVPRHTMIEGPLDVDVEVFPYTVNDPSRAGELVEFGVAGIITDDPGHILDYFEGHS